MAEQYSRHVSKIVVSQLAETAGFHAVQESAVDVLADLMLRYIAQLGSASHSYAELAGRTDCNINDLVSVATGHLVGQLGGPLTTKLSVAAACF